MHRTYTVHPIPLILLALNIPALCLGSHLAEQGLSAQEPRLHISRTSLRALAPSERRLSSKPEII